VAVRATLAAGTITIRATSHGLAAASVTVASRPVPMADGFTTSLPRLPEAVPAERAAVATAAVPPGLARPAASSTSGRFVRSFSYSGPTAGVGVQRDAQDGKRVFADRDLRFAGLPPSLRGADYVQASAADGLYSAVDLMELAVAAGTVVSIAHDDRLSRPEWLTRQFQPTPAKLAIGGQAMTVFARRAEGDESLTLGANTETREVAAAQMYVVFVSPAR
jgi:beta-galactosidase